MSEPTITLTKPGTAIEFSGQRSWGEKRTVTIDREWEVSIDGEVIGYVSYRLLTRERRTPGKRTVNARWQPPGWETHTERFSRGLEAMTKKEAIERLVRDHERRTARDDV